MGVYYLLAARQKIQAVIPLLSQEILVAENTLNADSPSLLKTFDVAHLGAFHYKILLVTGYHWIWAAFGVSIVGFLLPDLKAEWGISSSQQGLVASAGLIGMMLGAVLAGWLADRIGRRKTILMTMLWIGCFSVLAALAWSYPALLGLRFLTGFGLGAVLPVGSTLVSEYSPTKYRGRLVVLLNGFWGLGSILASLVGYWLAAEHGWRLPLLFGALSITAAPLAYFFLPESLRFLLSKGRLEEAKRIAAQVSGAPVEGESLGLPVQAQEKPKVAPWSKAYRMRTLSLWVLWFTLNFTFQGAFIWLPSILVSNGYSTARSFFFVLIISIGQIPGALAAAGLADLASRRLTLGLFVLAWGLGVALLGFAGSSTMILVSGLIFAVANGAVFGLAYPVTTELYPTRMRATATGWASGMGRVGGILAPLGVGWLVQAGLGTAGIFSLLALAPVAALLAVAGLRQETTGRTLEEITG